MDNCKRSTSFSIDFLKLCGIDINKGVSSETNSSIESIIPSSDGFKP